MTAPPTTYEALYTLKGTASLVNKDNLDLLPTDSIGNLLQRPEIDDADAPPAYSVDYSELGRLSILDPLSSSALSTVTSLSPNRLRLVQLHNPDAAIELKNKSLIGFEWTFEWQDMRFAWSRIRESLSTRETGFMCKISRKPDPDIACVVYKLAKKGNLVQILDYNLRRFAIDDRKGLEVVLLSTLFSMVYSDKLEAIGRGSPNAQNIRSKSPSPQPMEVKQSSDEVETGEANEVLISAHLSEQAYVEHCLTLLNDPNLIYLSLVASSSETVQRAILVASEVKRQRMKDSLEREELMQFIDYPGRAQRKNSNDPENKTPPTKIKIYLSRIPLEELVPQQPGSTGSGRATDRSLGTASFVEKQNGNEIRQPSKPPLPPKTSTKSSSSSSKVDGENTKKKRFWR